MKKRRKGGCNQGLGSEFTLILKHLYCAHYNSKKFKFGCNGSPRISSGTTITVVRHRHGEGLLHLDSGTLTPLLKRMEMAGLISRTRDAHDERRVLIELTASGEALRTDARKVPAILASRLALDKMAIIELRDQVRSLVQVLEKA